MRDLSKLKRWLIVLAVLYLVFPRDLIPDYLGWGLGLVDDVLLMAVLAYFYRKRMRKHEDGSSRHETGQGSGQASGRDSEEPTERPLDPYAVLDVDASASKGEIQSAYKARMHEYHPDKVAHLGEELQRVAHRKVLEIREAYEMLQK